ncbi:hypothetical protein G195_008237 [Phytophthora kernoviae 00238/432]|uniref:Uncharacterized protein n=1 Tax=Phytophthora kernoviae 00238/432 TaxID=1284355 RepID=A0A8J4W935_9STRA|nr:hypothetical protein G195_008237 [Phytophthora kernoviae 00238/432]
MVDTDAVALGTMGVNSIADLTGLSFDKTLVLRQIMPICDYIALAKLVVEQCTVQATQYEGQEYANVNVIQGVNGAANAAAAQTTVAQDESNWDGCTHIGSKVTDAKTGRLRWADVLGVDQVQVLRDVFVDAQESGLTAPDYYDNDVWYRDARRPLAQFTVVPTSGSSETDFRFESDKTSCVFEYYLLNTVQQLVVRNWTLTLGELDIGSWLDSGTFMLRIRARDPAGNVDEKFEDGRNEYTWEYVRPLPWGLIIGLSCVALVLLAGFLMEWRKRRKRAAMERYAMKRMRRKLKKKNGAVATAKEGDANWRETYDNAKDGKKGKKKSTKRKPTISKDKAKNKDKKETAKRKEKSASKSKTKDNSKVKDKTKTKSKKDDGKKTTKKTLTKDEKKKKTRASDTTGKTKAKTKDVSTKTKMKGSTKTTEKRASTASKKDKSDKKKPHDKSKSSEKKKTK